MRLAGIEKGGYNPYPPHMAEPTASWFIPLPAGKRPCGAPLFEYTGARRWSIAEYIKDKASWRFQIVVGDEVHEYKAKASDRGVAFHQLVEASRCTLTLTGTYFGGKSTSIFWLLHRLNPAGSGPAGAIRNCPAGEGNVGQGSVDAVGGSCGSPRIAA